jgi:hypothetical protein
MAPLFCGTPFGIKHAFKQSMNNTKKYLLSLIPASLLLMQCGGAELSTEENLGWADQEPWDERMATAGLNTVADVAASGGCSTAAVRQLSDQIVAEMNCIRPGLMANISGANVSLGPAALPYLQTSAAQDLRAATNGRSRLSLNSTLRSVAQQFILFQWGKTQSCGVQIAASPGRSNHEDGAAIDTSSYDAWRGILSNHGFRWYGSGDRVHFDHSGVDAQGVLAFQRLWNRNNPSDRISADGLYGPQTEARLKRSPRLGFPGTQKCN